MGHDLALTAFRAIYDANVDYVHATLRRLGVTSAEVEDVAHDVFVAVVRHLHAYDPARPLRPWRRLCPWRRLRPWLRRASPSPRSTPSPPPRRPRRR